MLTAFAKGGWIDERGVEVAAISLHGLLDGLAVHLLLHPITDHEAEGVVDRWLAASLTEPGS